MSIRSFADFNRGVPRGSTTGLAGADTVAPEGHPLVDHINQVETFAGHARGLSHGHRHPEVVVGPVASRSGGR
jgi:hypothetical protein